MRRAKSANTPARDSPAIVNGPMADGEIDFLRQKKSGPRTGPRPAELGPACFRGRGKPRRAGQFAPPQAFLTFAGGDISNRLGPCPARGCRTGFYVVGWPIVRKSRQSQTEPQKYGGWSAQASSTIRKCPGEKGPNLIVINLRNPLNFSDQAGIFSG